MQPMITTTVRQATAFNPPPCLLHCLRCSVTPSVEGAALHPTFAHGSARFDCNGGGNVGPVALLGGKCSDPVRIITSVGQQHCSHSGETGVCRQAGDHAPHPTPLSVTPPHRAPGSRSPSG